MKTILITGASGYIGSRLVARLAELGEYRIKVLTRHREANSPASGLFPSGVEVVIGDLRNPDLLKEFFEPGCTVINLVYMWNAGAAENLAVTTNLLKLCKTAGVDRIIHCSTAAVVGRVSVNHVTENTIPNPCTEYGNTKLDIEKFFLQAQDFCDIAILRPTAVFGIDGAPLKKLVSDLASGSRLRNYLKSCLFGYRRMNLVHIDNVVASIVFLIDCHEKFGAQSFIISDDDDPSNNFADVEGFLMDRLGIPAYKFSRIFIPLAVLGFILKALGRNNVNPRCDYSPNKLINMGFDRPISFKEGLKEYADWQLTARARR